MLEHEPGGTDRRRVQQITAAGMKIQQPGMCSGGGCGGGADHGGCKGGDGGCDRGVSLQRPPEEGAPGVPGGQGSPRAIAGRLSSGSAGKCSSETTIIDINMMITLFVFLTLWFIVCVVHYSLCHSYGKY